MASDAHFHIPKRKSVDALKIAYFADCWLLIDQRMVIKYGKLNEDSSKHCNLVEISGIAKEIGFSSKRRNQWKNGVTAKSLQAVFEYHQLAATEQLSFFQSNS